MRHSALGFVLAAWAAGCTPGAPRIATAQKESAHVSTEAKSPASPDRSTAPFDLALVPQLTGHPAARVVSWSAYLPDVYWIILDGEVASDQVGVSVIVDAGRIDPARGYSAAARWLHRIRIQEARDIDPIRLALVLDRLEALPPGFAADQITAIDRASGEKGGLRFDPFEIELVATHYRPPSPPGPGGAAPPPPAPSGGAPPTPARAILRSGDSDRFTWTVDVWNGAERRWDRVLTRPLEL